MARVRSVVSAELSKAELTVLRRLLDQAYEGRFAEDDWHHTVGGLHLLAVEEGEVVAHAAVVARTLVARGRARCAPATWRASPPGPTAAGRAMPCW
jgi:aminoglycoside 2'-N-acetyltransferase I